MEVDSVLTKLGYAGKFQILHLCFIETIACLGSPWHMFGITWIGYSPPHHCKVPAGTQLPMIDKHGEMVIDMCHIYKNISIDNTTIPCPDGWIFENTVDVTIVTEWNLVCDKDYIPHLSQVVLVFGVLVGALLSSPFSDRFGRKTVHMTCQLFCIVVGITTAFSFNITMFIILRFFTGVFISGIALSSFLQKIELLPAASRTLNAVTGVVYTITLALFALFGYLIRNWRHFQTTISMIQVLSLTGICLSHESIPWLVANGRIAEAERIVLKAAKMNGVKMPEKIFETDHPTELTPRSKDFNPITNGHAIGDGITETDNKDHPKRETIFTYLRQGKLVLNTLAMCFIWFNASLGYYSISLAVSGFNGNRFLNFFIIALMEIPAVLTFAFIIFKCPRRKGIFGLQLVAAVALVFTAFIPKKIVSGFNLGTLSFSFSMLGFVCFSTLFGCAYMYSGEIYPTNVRNIGMGISSMSARIGGMLAPFAGYFDTRFPFFSGTFLGVVSLISGLTTLYLPETFGRPLPQTTRDMKDWNRSVYIPGKDGDRERLMNDQNEEETELTWDDADLPVEELNSSDEDDVFTRAF